MQLQFLHIYMFLRSGNDVKHFGFVCLFTVNLLHQVIGTNCFNKPDSEKTNKKGKSILNSVLFRLDHKFSVFVV